MRVTDLTVEVRDRTLKRVGQVTPLHLDLKARTRWSAVGEWTLTLPGDHGMVPHLATPGSGIILLGPDGTSDGVILSGPTRTPARKRDRQNPDGTYTFSGVTDEIVLAGALAFPDPSIADPQASSRSRANDSRTGTTEALMREFVGFNVANGALAVGGAVSWAPAGRLRGLRTRTRLQAVSGARGVSQSKSPRFQNLLELLQEMVAYDPALGFRVVQVGSVLEFQVIDSRDRTKFVRFDVENGTITSEEVQTSGPVVTDAIVAGQGEGAARTIVQRRDAESIAAEDEWGVPFERFIDQRDTDDMVELQQSGDEALEEARGGTAVKMVPADDTTMEVGKDWRAGDLVTTVVASTETVARVTEVAYIASSAGVLAGAALGDVSGFTATDAESTTVQSLDSRVSRLERAGGTGAVETTDWNAATAAGMYWGNGAANAPAAGMVMGRVMRDGSSRIVQEVPDPSDLLNKTWRRVYSGGSWGAWKLVGTGGLPDPVYGQGSAPVGVTATSWANLPGMSALSLDLPQAAWVQITFGSWMNSASDLRIGARLTGATVTPSNDPSWNGRWGRVMRKTAGYEQMYATYVEKFNAGVTQAIMSGYRAGSGSDTHNYTTFELVPLRWA